MPRHPREIEEERRRLAIALRVAGHTWPEIGERMSVHKRSAARLVERERERWRARGDERIAYLLEVADP
jgi:transposase